MEIKSVAPAGSGRSQQDKLLRSFQSFSTIVRRTTISTTTIVRKTLTKLPFLGNFSNLGGGGGGGGGEEGVVEKKDGFEKNEENSSCCHPSPNPPRRPPKPHPGQKVGRICGN